MKSLAVGIVVALTLASILPDADAASELVIESGRDVAVTAGFPIGEGANSNPGVVQASVDPVNGRITLSGKKPGTASYVAFDARDRARSVEYRVRVVTAKKPAPARKESAEEVVRIAVGSSVKMKIPFPLGSGDNSNPGALAVAADAANTSIELSGRAPGVARYTVVDANDGAHSLAYRVEILARE